MKIINIGIVAHIDAGKTTLTENILYKSGAISRKGRVDHADTVTDQLELEKKKGITIKEATVSFYWKDIKFNLLDTPGHADFFSEVSRSLQVLDLAILVISAKEGIRRGRKKGILGWELSDMRIVLADAYYDSVMSTPADFRNLAPEVLRKVLLKTGTELLEPLACYEIITPSDYCGKIIYEIEKLKGYVDQVEVVGEVQYIKGGMLLEHFKNFGIYFASETKRQGTLNIAYIKYQKQK